MRLAPLKKIAQIHIAISVVLIAISVGLTSGGYYLYAEHDENLASVTRRANSANSTIQSKEAELNKALAALPVYQDIRSKQGNKPSQIDRDALQELAAELKKKYAILELKINIGPVTILKDDALTSQSIQVEHSLLTITMGALNDEMMLSFVDELTRRMPGMLRVEYLNLKRVSDMDTTFFQSLIFGSLSPTVKGSITIHWMGIRYPEGEEGAS